MKGSQGRNHETGTEAGTMENAAYWLAPPPAQGWYLPQGAGPSHINQENAAQTCSQGNLVGPYSQPRFPLSK